MQQGDGDSAKTEVCEYDGEVRLDIFQTAWEVGGHAGVGSCKL